MLIRVEPNADVPVFQQIVDQVKAAIARGACRPGDVIPSVRQMAADSLVNPNTVARSYRELEREGVVVTRRGFGVIVAPNATERCRQDRRTAIRDGIAELVRDALDAGLTPCDVRNALEEALGGGTGTGEAE